MAKLTPTSADSAITIVSGTFTATGQSGAGVMGAASGKNSTQFSPYGNFQQGQTAPQTFFRDFNLALWGTFAGTIQLEKSFNGGTTWLPINEDNTGTPAAYTGPVCLSGFEPEYGVLYRWNCTAYTSGTVNYRISQ